jgi:hypothetical protein
MDSAAAAEEYRRTTATLTALAISIVCFGFNIVDSLQSYSRRVRPYQANNTLSRLFLWF